MNKSLIPSKTLDFFGRAFMAAVFVNALPGKLNDFFATLDYISSRGVPEPLVSVLLVSAIVVLAVGSILFVVGSNTRLGESLPFFLGSHNLDLSHFYGSYQFSDEPDVDRGFNSLYDAFY